MRNHVSDKVRLCFYRSGFVTLCLRISAGKPAVSVSSGSDAGKSGYEIAPSSGKEFQENDSVEVKYQ